jgi:hypothetical protein
MIGTLAVTLNASGAGIEPIQNGSEEEWLFISAKYENLDGTLFWWRSVLAEQPR